MENLPNDWIALLVMALFLGIKHGMDADHLATIDGIARYNQASNPKLSRRTGLYFSLGHGVVVMVIALTIGMISNKIVVPNWLEGFGTWVSIIFLIALGTLNLYAIFKTPANQVVKTVGLKGRWFKWVMQSNHPVLIACVGALFALSFDTISQAALFSMAATQIAGWPFSIVVCLAFIVGMIITDGINGLWVSNLLKKADKRAVIASRVMGLTIAGISLSIAALSLTRFYSTSLNLRLEGHSLLLGCWILCIVAASYLIALHISRNYQAVE